MEQTRALIHTQRENFALPHTTKIKKREAFANNRPAQSISNFQAVLACRADFHNIDRLLHHVHVGLFGRGGGPLARGGGTIAARRPSGMHYLLLCEKKI